MLRRDLDILTEDNAKVQRGLDRVHNTIEILYLELARANGDHTSQELELERAQGTDARLRSELGRLRQNRGD
jgi:hypothetical protein